MPELIVLGSSSALPNEEHENTHLCLTGEKGHILIDCVGSTLLRLQQAKVDPLKLTDIIISHFHPDHVSGLPSIISNVWLLGGRAPIRVHGLAYTMNRAEKMMNLYDFENWPNFIPVSYHPYSDERMALVLENEDFRIRTSLVKHLLPTSGYRFESLKTGGIIAYSCDTEPCPAVVELAKGADVLIHEATGPFQGHSSAAQAGDIAQAAGVRSLYLIHYPPQVFGSKEILDEARKHFNGQVSFAEDLMDLEF